MYQTWAAARSIVFITTWVLFTLIWFVPCLLAALLLPLKRRNLFITRSYSCTILYLARFICGIRWHIEGAKNLPKDKRSYVILSKHQSTWETLFLAMLFAPQVPVVKKELSYLPIFGWILSMIQPIFIDRSHKTNALKQVFQQGKERLQQGINITIFPEGTRVPEGNRKEFSRSGAMLAARNQAPALAVAHNSAECWPNNSWIKYPGTISVVISSVFEPDALTANQLNQQVEEWINQQVDNISKKSFSGDYLTASTSGKRF